MIFKPLRIATDNLSTMRSFHILKVYQWFPACLHTQRITIAFSKSIHKVHKGIQIFHPKDSIFIKSLQITGLIKLYQFGNHSLLFRIFSYAFRFLQPVYNLIDSLSVQTTHFPNLFLNLAVLFHQATVQTVRNRRFIFRVFHYIIEVFSFFLRHTVIIVASRSQH